MGGILLFLLFVRKEMLIVNLALRTALAMIRHRKSRRPTFTAIASILGISFGVAAFLVVVTIFDSFKKDLQSILRAANPHLVVYSISNPIPDARNFLEEVRQGLSFSVDRMGLFEYTEGLLSHGHLTGAVVVRGIEGTRAANAADLEGRISPAPGLGLIDSESLPGEPPAVILGKGLASRIGVESGDEVSLLTARQDGQQVTKILRVVGVLSLGLSGYDNRLALMNFVDASRVFGSPGSARGIEIRFVDPDVAELAANRIEDKVPYYVQPWQAMDRNLFMQVKRDETVVSFIVLIISLVAGFNVLTTQSLGVVDRAKQIALLRALGASRVFVMRVFLTLGAILGVGGAILGVGFGLAILRFFEDFDLGDLRSTYFVDRIPVHYDPILILQACGVALILALLSSVYPAYRATRVSPLFGIKPGFLMGKEDYKG